VLFKGPAEIQMGGRRDPWIHLGYSNEWLPARAALAAPQRWCTPLDAYLVITSPISLRAGACWPILDVHSRHPNACVLCTPLDTHLVISCTMLADKQDGLSRDSANECENTRLLLLVLSSCFYHPTFALPSIFRPHLPLPPLSSAENPILMVEMKANRRI
jgi:hypothetical protein